MALILISLITWRLAVLLVVDGGPGDVFARLRLWATGESGTYVETTSGGIVEFPGRVIPWLGGMLTCVGCASLWMAPVAYAVVRWAPDEIALIAAAWGAATLAHRLHS